MAQRGEGKTTPKIRVKMRERGDGMERKRWTENKHAKMRDWTHTREREKKKGGVEWSEISFSSL